MENRLLKLLGDPAYTPSNVPQLIKALHLRPGQQQEMQSVLKDLVTRGLIIRTKGNRYIQAAEADLVPGVISINRAGKGFVQPDEPGLGEIVVTDRNQATAMH
ncbi:MAG: ribonuclease R, partial [bacterium]